MSHEGWIKKDDTHKFIKYMRSRPNAADLKDVLGLVWRHCATGILRKVVSLIYAKYKTSDGVSIIKCIDKMHNREFVRGIIVCIIDSPTRMPSCIDVKLYDLFLSWNLQARTSPALGRKRNIGETGLAFFERIIQIMPMPDRYAVSMCKTVCRYKERVPECIALLLIDQHGHLADEFFERATGASHYPMVEHIIKNVSTTFKPSLHTSYSTLRYALRIGYEPPITSVVDFHTPLGLMCKHGDSECIKILLNQQHDPNHGTYTVFPRVFSLLIKAGHKGHNGTLVSLKSLIKKQLWNTMSALEVRNNIPRGLMYLD